MQQHVGDWVVIHTDKAGAYPQLLQELLSNRECVKMDSVSHSAKQWTRFCRHPVEGHPEVCNIRVTDGTQCVESMWRMLKEKAIPKESRANMQELEAYSLQYLARRWHTGDPLTDLGRAVGNFMHASCHDPWTANDYLTRRSNDDGEETDLDDEMLSDLDESDMQLAAGK